MADQSSFLKPLLLDLTYGASAWKKPVKVVATSNVTQLGTQTIDGVALAAEDEVLCVGQTSGAQNGVFVVASGAWTRRADCATGDSLFEGCRVPVTRGTHADEVYRLVTTGRINVGVTSQSWELDGAAAGGGTITDVTHTAPIAVTTPSPGVRNVAITAATASVEGSMSAIDKAKVDAGWILTRAAVSAIAVPADHTLSYCAEVDAHYRFSLADSSTADAWTILTGDGGRWYLQGDRIAISPLGDGLDDAPRVEEALGACAYKVWVELLPGHWIWETVCSVASGASLRGSPEVHIDSSITPSGGAPTESPFYATPPAATVTTGLAVAAAAGDLSIEVDDATGLAEDDEIAIIEGNQVSPHVIVGIAGDVLTLDTPVLASFTTAAVVRDWVAPKDIRIVGNGMRITGTGDAAIELVGAVRAHVEGVRVEDCSFVAILINFDVGSRDCVLKHCVLDGCDAVINGWHFESAQSCYAENVTTRRATQGGVFLPGGSGHTIVGCESTECGTGSILTAATGTNGARNITMIGCRFDRNGAGIDIQNGSTSIALVGGQATGNTGAGVAVNGGTAASGDVHISDFIADGNQNGFVIVAGSVGNTLSGCQANECVDYGLLSSGEALVDGLVSRECGSGGVSADSAAHLMLLNARLSRAANDDWNAIRQEGTARIDAAHVLVTMGGTGTKIVVSSVSSGVTDLSHLRTVGGTFGIVTATGTVRRGPGVDLSSIAAPGDQWIVTTEADVTIGPIQSYTGTTKRLGVSASQIDIGAPAIVTGHVSATTYLQAGAGTKRFQDAAPSAAGHMSSDANGRITIYQGGALRTLPSFDDLPQPIVYVYRGDAAAGDIFAEKPIGGLTTKALAGIEIALWFDDDVLSDDTDFATITIRRRDPDGLGTFATLAQAVTTTTGGTGDITGGQALALTPVNTTVPALYAVTMQIEKAGSGVQLPGFTAFVIPYYVP